MRFVICGAGAIGGVPGGQLAKAGFAVILIDTMPEHMEMAVARALPDTYTVQQLRERVWD